VTSLALKLPSESTTFYIDQSNALSFIDQNRSAINSFAAQYSIKKVPSAEETQYIYSFSINGKSKDGTNTYPLIFFTGLQECNPSFQNNDRQDDERHVRRKLLNLQRQLLVGLRDIRVLSQQKEHESLIDVYTSQISAKNDSTSIFFVLYSFLQSSCLNDVIFWSKDMLLFDTHNREYFSSIVHLYREGAS
jgi:hypothetical protein